MYLMKQKYLVPTPLHPPMRLVLNRFAFLIRNSAGERWFVWVVPSSQKLPSNQDDDIDDDVVVGPLRILVVCGLDFGT